MSLPRFVVLCRSPVAGTESKAVWPHPGMSQRAAEAWAQALWPWPQSVFVVPVEPPAALEDTLPGTEEVA